MNDRELLEATLQLQSEMLELMRQVLQMMQEIRAEQSQSRITYVPYQPVTSPDTWQPRTVPNTVPNTGVPYTTWGGSVPNSSGTAVCQNSTPLTINTVGVMGEAYAK